MFLSTKPCRFAGNPPSWWFAQAMVVVKGRPQGFKLQGCQNSLLLVHVFPRAAVTVIGCELSNQLGVHQGLPILGALSRSTKMQRGETNIWMKWNEHSSNDCQRWLLLGHAGEAWKCRRLWACALSPQTNSYIACAWQDCNGPEVAHHITPGRQALMLTPAWGSCIACLPVF